MGSTIITYQKFLSSIGSPDGVITFTSPLKTENTRRKTIRLIKVSFSSLIPNVFNHDSVNNGLIRLSRDGGATWTSVQLPNGVYELSHIEAGLNTAVSAWWTDATDPGIKLRYNLASQIVYVNLDSSKLVAPGTQLGIDFGASLAYQLLGFDLATSEFTADGLHWATNYARLNWFGDSISVLLDGAFGALSLQNGMPSTVLCTVPLSTSGAQNEYVYPQGIYTPEIPVPGAPDMLSSIHVKFIGSRQTDAGATMPILILEGNIELTLQYSWA